MEVKGFDPDCKIMTSAGLITVNTELGTGKKKSIDGYRCYFPEFEELLYIDYQARQKNIDPLQEIGKWALAVFLRMPIEIGKPLVYCDKKLHVCTSIDKHAWFEVGITKQWDYGFLMTADLKEGIIRMAGWLPYLTFVEGTWKNRDGLWHVNPIHMSRSLQDFDKHVLEKLHN